MGPPYVVEYSEKKPADLFHTHTDTHTHRAPKRPKDFRETCVLQHRTVSHSLIIRPYAPFGVLASPPELLLPWGTRYPPSTATDSAPVLSLNSSLFITKSFVDIAPLLFFLILFTCVYVHLVGVCSGCIIVAIARGEHDYTRRPCRYSFSFASS